jgi:hypothetical protein
MTPGIFISFLMTRAFEFNVINISFDWPLACGTQVYSEGMGRKI